jgi:hypothetical protein
MNPQRTFALSPGQPEFSDDLPGQSITAYSTYRLTDADPGITVESNP